MSDIQGAANEAAGTSGLALQGALQALASRSGTYVAGKAQATAPSSPAVGEVWIDTSTVAGASCRAYKSGPAQLVANTTFASITFDAEEYDDAAFHDNVTNPSRFVIPATGRYRVVAQVSFAPNSTGLRFVQIARNGARVVVNTMPPDTSAAGSNRRMQVHAGVLVLTAGDYIEVQFYQDSGGSLNVYNGQTETWLCIERVG